NGDGAHCQGGALGTPFSLRTAGTSPRKLLADAYRPAKPVTGTASRIGSSSATLHGSVNPVGAAVRVRFDFGKTTSYGKRTAFRRVKPANVATAIGAALSGLPPRTTLHYRIEVRTDCGSLVGADRTFTTKRATRLTIGASRTVTNGTTVTVATRLTDMVTRNSLARRRVQLFARHSRT